MLSHVRPAQAAKRPSAGFGAGAFAFPGAEVSNGTCGAAAPLTQPGWPAAAVGRGHAQDWYVRPRRVGGLIGANSINASTSNASAASASTSISKSATKQFDLMTRVAVPVFRGGVGPHPGREPRPV